MAAVLTIWSGLPSRYGHDYDGGGPPLHRGRALRTFELAVPSLSGTAEPAGTSLQLQVADEFYIPRLLQRDGLASYEPETLACFLALVERHGGPVFDVGANVGVFALVAAAVTGADVTAFEPTPDLATAMRQIASDNELEFSVEEIALGAENGEASFYLSNLTDSSNSLLAGFRPSDRALTVPVEQLDRYCERVGTTPRVLKVDTEATEPDVFAGGMNTIREQRPYIICEVLARRSESDLEHVLGDLDYTWYQITEEVPLVRRREIFGDRTYRFNNWLFAPEPLDDRFFERSTAWRQALSACVPLPPSTDEGGQEKEPPAAAVRSPGGKDGDTSRPKRKRGVYGRKKMLGGITTGFAAGVAAAEARHRLGPRRG